MAVLFIILFITIILSYKRSSPTLLWLLAFGWSAAAVMFWYSMTSTLLIRW